MTQLVVIYVRKPKAMDGKEGRPEGRMLSFKSPENLDYAKFLDLGFYFDGNSTICEFIPGPDPKKPFPELLRQKELELLRQLEADGYDVDFQ